MSTILYFGATWCGPCKAVKAVLNELIEEEDLDVTFYDIEAFPTLTKQYNIRGIPTLLKVDENLEIVGLPKVGMQSKVALKAWMED